MNPKLPDGFLALPQADGATFARLTRKLRLLVLRRLLVSKPQTLPAPLSGALRRLQPFLQSLAADKQLAPRLLWAIGGLDVLTPMLCAEGGQLPLARALEQSVPTLLLRLGQRLPPALSRETMLWDVPVQEVVEPASGCAYRFEPAALGLLLQGTNAEVRHSSAGDFGVAALRDLDDEAAARMGIVTRRSHAIGDSGARLALHDSNPLSMFEEHPDKDGNAIDLAGRSAEEWTEKLREALALIALALPNLHKQMCGFLQRVVPVGFHAQQHLSASYREAPGLVYLSLHPSTLTMAEALIHEFQHGKLNTLRWFDAILHNAESTWTESPVRPDMRPLIGVLMGVHAFIPVAALHRRLEAERHPVAQSPHFARRREEVTTGNDEGLATLSRLAEPSAIGKRVMAALQQLHDATRLANFDG